MAAHTMPPVLTIKTTDLPLSSFPDYIDPFESSGDTYVDDIMASPVASSPSSKLFEKLRADPERHPSPQPTHFSVPVLSRANGNGHRVMRSATVGYVAPEFKGKAEQMKQGKWLPFG